MDSHYIDYVYTTEVRLIEDAVQSSYEKPEQQPYQGSPTIPQQQSKEGLNRLPAVDLSSLSQDQRTLAEAMLREEYESFAFSEEEIGCIPDLEKLRRLPSKTASQFKTSTRRCQGHFILR